MEYLQCTLKKRQAHTQANKLGSSYLIRCPPVQRVLCLVGFLISSQMDDKDIKMLEHEKQELRLLINQGISFTISYQEERIVRVPRFKHLPWLFPHKKKVMEECSRDFVIKEPTAYTLDRLSAEYIELTIDEQTIKNDPRQQARKLYKEHSVRMARIVAIAILGNEWEDNKKLEELTEFLHKWLKNSKLFDVVQAVDLTNNLADFINSMRLMSSARTTMPIRIESQED